MIVTKENIDAITQKLIEQGIGQKELPEPLLNDAVGQVLTLYAQEFIEEFRAKINEYSTKKNTTLENSHTFTPYQSETGKTFVSIEAPEYWKFFNYGVSGNGNQVGENAYDRTTHNSLLDFQFRSDFPSTAMVDNLLEWLPQTGLLAGADNYRSVGYGMARNILRRGISAKPYVNDVVEDSDIVDRMAESIADITGEAMVEVLFSELEKNK